jgi:hypothetical protein
MNGLVPIALAEHALVVSHGRSQPMVSVVARPLQVPTLTWFAATNKNANAVTKVFVIVRLVSALVSLATLVHLANVLLAPMTALDTELAAPTGILLTTGRLLKPSKS